MTARTGQDPSRVHGGLTRDLGQSFYAWIDAPATARQKSLLSKLSPDQAGLTEPAGGPVRAKLTRAPGDAPFGGLKMVTDGGWFAARPSGTEDVYKLYAESFQDAEHLAQIQAQA